MGREWLTVPDAAELTGYHVYYLRELLRTGKIKAQKFGRTWMVSRRSLVAYVRSAEKSKDKRRGSRGLDTIRKPAIIHYVS